MIAEPNMGIQENNSVIAEPKVGIQENNLDNGISPKTEVEPTQMDPYSCL